MTTMLRLLIVSLALGAPVAVAAQSPNPPPPTPSMPVINLPTVTVVAQKEPTPLERVPASITVVSGETLRRAGATVVSDAALFAPNTFYADLSARKVSNARFRGIGASPANPSVTTVIDGVPQLNANSSNIDLLDVEQVELVRGAHSALFGRNTLGGVVNVTSRRPLLTAREGRVSLPLGSNGERGLALSVNGPVVDGRLGGSLALAYNRRDGFTTNTLTGKQFDDRSMFAMKGQLFYQQVTGPWRAHVIVAEERDRDGDYTLGDLASIRATPFEVTRDFEGRTERDVLSLTAVVSRERGALKLSSTTGVVRWSTFDETDLDYTVAPAMTRTNDESTTQITQEFRVASAEARELLFPAKAMFTWQAGAFLFTQGYEQVAVNRFSPFVLSPQLPTAVAQHAPDAALDDSGVGLFGQATVTMRERIDASVALRFDREQRTAQLSSFYEPAVFPATTVDAERSFTSASPQFSVVFRQQPGRTYYASVARGFKAGGFNPTSPVGAESYGQEAAWHIEAGARASFAAGRVSTHAAVFSIDWSDLQLNTPVASAPGQFYIANVGAAASRGAEVTVTARVRPDVDTFATLGFTSARFSEGSVSSGLDVSDNKIPFTPAATATVGAEYRRPWQRGAELFARGEVAFVGAFEYDDLNSARQEAYNVANLRFGLRRDRVSAEFWMRNAFDTRYVPVAFAYDPRLAPSGFLGEPGKPRTFGVRVTVDF